MEIHVQKPPRLTPGSINPQGTGGASGARPTGEAPCPILYVWLK